MLFHVKQTHTPENCPYQAGGSRSLFDAASSDVKLHGYYLAFPEHTIFLIVETDDVAKLQAFLAPGAKRATCEVTVVSDRPAP